MRFQSTLIEAELARLLESWLGGSVSIQRGEQKGLIARTTLGALNLVVLESDRVSALAQAVSVSAGESQVVVVPFMGPKGAAYASSRSLSWLDLSGNADVRGPGIRVLIQGNPNRFRISGRPTTIFSPRASRISRAMLVDDSRWWQQAEIAATCSLSRGFVSKVVSRMIESELVDRRKEDERVHPRSPSVLLDAWAQDHDFSRNTISRFHAVGRDGQTVTKNLASRMNESGIRWAATGLPAAWMWSRFADYRLTTLYVSTPLLHPEELGLRPVEQGENVWVVQPRDEGVFHASKHIESIPCVHPVQVYLDLLGHPERSKEAAAKLRSDLLTWRT